MTTEGDAFQFVFHHPEDAVAYALAAQQALLTAKWPPELEQHYRSRTRYASDICSSEEAQLAQAVETPCKPHHAHCITGVHIVLHFCSHWDHTYD